MQTLKRVVAVIVIALSIIGIIVCVGGILGAWTISSALSNAATRVLTLAESPLNTASQGTATVANSVGSIRETLATIDQAVTGVGDKITSNNPVMDFLSNAVEEKLGPAIDSVREKVLGLRDGVVGLNNTLEALNSIPGVHVPTLTNELEAIADRLASVRTAVQEFRAYLLQIKSELVTGAISAVTSRTAKVDVALNQIQESMNNLSAKAAETQAQVAVLKATLPGVLNLVATIMTLLLILFAAGQVTLLMYGWAWFKHLGSAKAAAASLPPAAGSLPPAAAAPAAGQPVGETPVADQAEVPPPSGTAQKDSE